MRYSLPRIHAVNGLINVKFEFSHLYSILRGGSQASDNRADTTRISADTTEAPPSDTIYVTGESSVLRIDCGHGQHAST